VIFLGSCSPIHCRIVVCAVGLVCTQIAVLAGQGICYNWGWEKTDMHDTIPFLMLGIGVDDIFVICNALDQTSLKLPATSRIKQALAHSGPSITITSVTNALAFYAGSYSSIVALRSFCSFCFVCIMMLYLSVLTVFLPVLFWDTWRVSKKVSDLFGILTFLKEDTIFCCKGRFLSQQQREFGAI